MIIGKNIWHGKKACYKMNIEWNRGKSDFSGLFWQFSQFLMQYISFIRKKHALSNKNCIFPLKLQDLCKQGVDIINLQWHNSTAACPPSATHQLTLAIVEYAHPPLYCIASELDILASQTRHYSRWRHHQIPCLTTVVKHVRFWRKYYEIDKYYTCSLQVKIVCTRKWE